MAVKKQETEISILEISYGKTDFLVLGKTPIILHRMSEKVVNEFLLPKGKKTAADKANSLKHNPYQEFRDAPYTSSDPNSDTFICHLATSFKKAIAGAALDIPGATKSQISRLLWVEGERIPIYGIPKLHMSITRSSDINHTPDVRTRCIIPEWAAVVTVRYMIPVLNETVVANLFAAAGMIQGIGDWRPQKGSGTFGQFELVSDNEKFRSIITNCGRAAQIEAMENPQPYDDETAELLTWFDQETEKRGIRMAV